MVSCSIFLRSGGGGSQCSVASRLFFWSIDGGLGCTGGSVLLGGCCSCGSVLSFYSGGCVLVGFYIRLMVEFSSDSVFVEVGDVQ